MTNQEYQWFAVDKVIFYLKEQGLKYRRSDFTLDQWWDEKKNGIKFIGKKNEPNGIMVILKYGFERTGKRLKSIKDKFLNYFNARVKDDGIYFTFSFRELDFDNLKGNNEEQEKIDKIMERVSKLLALADAEKNNSEAEAIAASMKAQELLAKYNLDIADIRGDQMEEEIEQCIADVGTGKKWKYSLAEALARSYCCRCYYIGAEQIIFYGYRQSTIMCRRIFVYLFSVGNRLSTAYVKEKRSKGEPTNSTYNSFCAGFVNGIDRELSRQCTALSLVVPKEVNDTFEIFSENFKKMDHSLNNLIDDGAYKEGIIEGKRALNAQYLEGTHRED